MPNILTILWAASELAAIAAVAVGLATLGKSVIEYTKQGSQKRGEQFVQMHQRFWVNPGFRRICELLQELDHPSIKDEPKIQAELTAELRGIALSEKTDFLGFLEEIALMVNSKLITKTVAHYMFGFYAIRCWENDNFWTDKLHKNDPYWVLFKDLF